jgi:hypothetical protein
VIEPDKIEYPEELKKACKKHEEIEEKAYKRKLLDEISTAKVEDSRGKEVCKQFEESSSSSSTDSDFGGSSESENGFEDYFTMFSSKIQQHML